MPFQLSRLNVGLAFVLALSLGACSTGMDEKAEPYADGPMTCPAGFSEALASQLNDIQAVGVLSAEDIGLGPIASDVACVVRTDSSQTGAGATVIMRAGLSESEVRHLLWDADFDDDLVRKSARTGEAKGAFLRTYRSLTSRWKGDQFGLSRAFPPRTVVVEAALNIPHVMRKCSGAELAKQNQPKKVFWSLAPPGKKVVSCRPQTPEEFKAEIDETIKNMPPGPSCRDVTTFDQNWQNDMLCTREDGSQFYTDYQGAVDYLGYDSLADIGR